MAASKAEHLFMARQALETVVVGASLASLLAVLFAVLRWRRSFEPLQERRRAHRVSLQAPVFVYGWSRGQPFSESTETVNVSALGGLVPLSAKVVLSQPLLVTNLQSDQDSSCRVARLARFSRGKVAVGFEFLPPFPGFWQVECVTGSSNR